MDIDEIKTRLWEFPSGLRLGLWAFTASVLDSISDQETRSHKPHSTAKQTKTKNKGSEQHYPS